MAFTHPLFYAGYTGVVPKGTTTKYMKWQDLDRADLRVAVKQGSAIDDFVRDNFKHAQIVRLSGADLTLPLAAVSAKQADVGLMNQLTVFTYLREHPELEEILSKDPVAPTYLLVGGSTRRSPVAEFRKHVDRLLHEYRRHVPAGRVNMVSRCSTLNSG